MGEASLHPSDLTVKRRLAPLLQKRQVGMKWVDGLPEPDIRTYIIGHGQQLAARRLSVIIAANEKRYGPVRELPATLSRQIIRRTKFKARKQIAAKARREALRATPTKAAAQPAP